MERYIEKNNQKLRYGYTTGSCAAAAAKAGVLALYDKKQAVVEIDTPKGWPLFIDVFHQKCKDGAHCYVIKDAGDDPDVTDGIRVHAIVRQNHNPDRQKKICIQGGVGIGIITKKGLSLDIGQAAINPVPLQMIQTEIEKVLPEQASVTVTIFVPQGIDTAKRTFNEKLGIRGGISIIGTTGVVEPMSEKALLDTFKVELSILRAEKNERLIFVFGNFGRDFLKDYSILESKMQKTSNFIGAMIEESARLGFKEILIVGHIGKMVKVAYNMQNTHSKYGDHRMESIYMDACKVGLSKNIAEPILECNTTDEAIEYLDSLNMNIRNAVCNAIVNRCQQVAKTWANNQLEVECIMFSRIYGQLSHTTKAMDLLKELRK